ERTPGGAVERGQVGIVAESAAGEVDRGQLLGDRLDGARERTRVGDAHLRGRAERRKGQGRDRSAHDPPDVVVDGVLDAVGGCDGALKVDAEEVLELDAEGDVELERGAEVPSSEPESDSWSSATIVRV